MSITFEAAYHEYASLVKMRVKAVLARYPDLVEETVQDAFVKVWRAFSQFPAEEPYRRGWLYRIATNAALDALRSRQCKPVESLDALVEASHGAFYNASEGLACDPYETHERVMLFQQVWPLLSAEDQRVLMLSAYGYEPVEIAARLPCPQQAVKMRLFRARERLHTCLRKVGV